MLKRVPAGDHVDTTAQQSLEFNGCDAAWLMVMGTAVSVAMAVWIGAAGDTVDDFNGRVRFTPATSITFDAQPKATANIAVAAVAPESAVPLTLSAVPVLLTAQPLAREIAEPPVAQTSANQLQMVNHQPGGEKLTASVDATLAGGAVAGTACGELPVAVPTAYTGPPPRMDSRYKK